MNFNEINTNDFFHFLPFPLMCNVYSGALKEVFGSHLGIIQLRGEKKKLSKN